VPSLSRYSSKRSMWVEGIAEGAAQEQLRHHQQQLLPLQDNLSRLPGEVLFAIELCLPVYDIVSLGSVSTAWSARLSQVTQQLNAIYSILGRCSLQRRCERFVSCLPISYHTQKLCNVHARCAQGDRPRLRFCETPLLLLAVCTLHFHQPLCILTQ
jgi:hypothetical protein